LRVNASIHQLTCQAGSKAMSVPVKGFRQYADRCAT
jgi:hypothetical protein